MVFAQSWPACEALRKQLIGFSPFPYHPNDVRSAYCHPVSQCKIKPVSTFWLWKTGIFWERGGDFRRELRALVGVLVPWRPTRWQKLAGFAGFLSSSTTQLAETGLAGWRRSTDRTGLWRYSLLTGNLTGIFENKRQFLETQRPRCAQIQTVTRIPYTNSEFQAASREFIKCISEIALRARA
jgi:hypothetical protein